MSNPSSLPSLSGAESASGNFHPPGGLSASASASDCPESPKAPSFSQRNTTLILQEEESLKIDGYSIGEITKAEKALTQRNITPTLSEICSHLQSVHADLGILEKGIENGLSSTAGAQGKLRLSLELQSYINSQVKVTTEYFNRHYSSFWPDRQGIISMVNQWPETLQKQAAVICKSWPELLVDNAVQVDFSSSIRICSPDLGSHSAPLDCLAFFRLVKDIWFDALSCKNNCVIDRVSHLLISFAWEISFNFYLLRGRSPTHDRHERFEQTVQHMLTEGISHIEDIDAFAFLLVTKPLTWRNHQSDVLQLMICRALKGRDQQLSPLRAQWQEDPNSHEQIAKTVETEIIPDTACAMHYLNDIHGYLMQYRRQHPNCSGSNQIHNAKYFDPVTRQLKSSILAPDMTTRPTLEETAATLSAYFNVCLDQGRQGSSPEGTFEDFLTDRKEPDPSKPGYFGLLESADNTENPTSKPDNDADNNAETNTTHNYSVMPKHKRKRQSAKPSVMPRIFINPW